MNEKQLASTTLGDDNPVIVCELRAMASRIESEFRKRCSDNAGLSPLLTQWEYDVRLVGRTLQAVRQTFPHYTAHDADHAEAILDRIGRVLGDRGVQSLSATDLWLLLECAYRHDTGMVVLSACQKQDFESPEFNEHLRQLAAGTDPDLRRAASWILEGKPRVKPLEIETAHFDVLLVHADFVRKRHADRAYAATIDSAVNMGATRSDTALVSERFWHIIGAVCRGHGEQASQVMRLPKGESGVAGELCHPRFAAFMLRLGDLLDLDSDRNCPGPLTTLPFVPCATAIHLAKHRGVRHFLVSCTRVEITAEYQDLEAYLQAEKWLNWLRDELTFQLLNWNDIAPTAQFVALPTPGAIEARLEGQVLVEHGARPRFEVDRDKLLGLVRGANIYNGPHDAVREVVQNAIDATLLRFAYESKCNGTVQPSTLNDLKKALENYPIDIRLDKRQEQTSSASNGRLLTWTLQVTDRGIGMRIDDVRRLLRLGSSGREGDRRVLTEWLPEWARPSGTFGIGFHSLFEYCSAVRVQTRHPLDSEGLALTFEKRKGQSEPTVIVRRGPSPSRGIPTATGTKLEADFEIPAEPHRVSLEPSGEVYHVLSEYDFVADTELPFEPARMRDMIRELAQDSLCMLQLDGANARSGSIDDRNTARWLFDPDLGIELEFRSIVTGTALGLIKYRSAEVSREPVGTMLCLDCNLHSGDARELLELSRNKLTEKGRATLKDKLRVASPKIVRQLLDHADFSLSQSIPLLSLWLHLFAKDDEHSHAEEWRRVTPNSEGDLTLGDIVDVEQLEVCNAHDVELVHSKVERGAGSIRIVLAHDDYPWLGKLILLHFNECRIGLTDGRLSRSFSHDSARSQDVSDDALVHFLELDRGHFGVGCRNAIPAPKRFAGLAIPETVSFWGHSWYDFAPVLMPNPFIKGPQGVTLPRIGNYVEWLTKHRKEPHTAIARQLLEFITHADTLLASTKLVRAYNLEGVRAELGRYLEADR